MTQQFPSDEKVEGKERKRVKVSPSLVSTLNICISIYSLLHPHPHDTTYGCSKSLQVNSTTLYSKSFFQLGFNCISLELWQAINPFLLHLSALKMISPSFSSSLPLPLPLPLFCLLFIMLGTPVSLTTPEYEREYKREFENCRDSMFKCGNIAAGFPFYGGGREKECGHPDLELQCHGDITRMEIHGVGYRVLEIRPDRQILRISSEEVVNKGICPPPFPVEDWILDPPVYPPGPGFASVTLFYDCVSPISPDLFFPCDKNDDYSNDYSNVSVAIANNTNIHPEGCSHSVNVSILQTSLESLRNHSSDWKGALETGFEVQWRKNYAEACGNCTSSGGACGFIHDQVYCYCPPGKWSGPEGKECWPLLLPPHK
ncbi:hypothetical protein Goklo_029291, partial [Gossypium klotzschianum]|nr:hypothetical protein [Gossypium klotzschianum]